MILTDELLAVVDRSLRRSICDENVCHEHAEINDVMSEEEPKVDGDQLGMLLPTGEETNDNG